MVRRRSATRRGDGRRDRGPLAGPLGRRGHLQRPNPTGPLAPADGAPVPQDKLYLLDMFPYPSGKGLHVGHPLGYIGTDVMGRYMRMIGRNVLHTIGYDAFGLPAEQYAVRTGTHPRTTTEENIIRYRAQLRRLGFAHDQRRSVATTDPEFFRWTQWIFTQLFEAWYDESVGRARPISALVERVRVRRHGRRRTAGRGPTLTHAEQHQVLAGYRLAYIDEAPVNWCPGLGTVLSNEEVTPDGAARSAIPGLPAESAAVDDADHRLRRPAAGRPGPAGLAGIGQGHAAQLDRPVLRRAAALPGGRRGALRERPLTWPVRRRHRGLHHPAGHPVRCDVHGAGAGAPAGRVITAGAWPEGTDHALDRRAQQPRPRPSPSYRREAANKTDLDRQENKEKTGVFTGAYAVNPATTPCCRCSSPTTC